MRFEHFALNVEDAKAMAEWYVEHCRMRVVRAMDETPFTHFLADTEGTVVMEIYSNPDEPVPAYVDQHPLRFHFAFAVAKAETVKQRLLRAGASPCLEAHLDDGSHLVMLRDPWGIPLQLCQRADPMVGP